MPQGISLQLKVAHAKMGSGRKRGGRRRKRDGKKRKSETEGEAGREIH